MKVLHVLERSAPELAGYTVRGGYILDHQRRLGFEPLVVTSPFFRGSDRQRTDNIDGIRYVRSNHIRPPDKRDGRLAAYWTRMNMVRRYRTFVADVARRERPSVIHAHSSYMNGLAARHASRRLGIPFVYEVRGLWADTQVVEEGLRPDSLKYRTFWQIELAVVRRANMVIAISDGIRKAMIARGVDPARIAVVPNGVDTKVFVPRPADRGLLDALGLNGCFIVGFIGSLRRLEGIELAIEAFRELHRRNSRARLLIVGDGTDAGRLRHIAAEAGLSDVVRFTGQVPHDQILSYYSILDVLVYPRIDAVINQTVTPLKPLEAMSMGKACLASDVGGLKELIEHGETGLLFQTGNARDLTDKLLLLQSNDVLRTGLVRRAQARVREEREWSRVAALYGDIYRRAGAAPPVSRSIH